MVLSLKSFVGPKNAGIEPYYLSSAILGLGFPLHKPNNIHLLGVEVMLLFGGSSQVSKWLITPIYKPFRPFGRGTTPVRGLTNKIPLTG